MAVDFGMIARFAERAQLRLAVCVVVATFAVPVQAAGTRAGTVIDNTASVAFELAGTQSSVVSNTATLRVAERLDVVVSVQTPQVTVTPNDIDRALLFTVTNTGNGIETFGLAMNSGIAGDDFDPVPAAPDAIYFDTDGSGDFSAGDLPYAPGVNDPTLGADESVVVLIINDIPGGVANADRGRSELVATAATGSGAPGTVFAGQGDAGTDAVSGATGASAGVFGEYIVDDIAIDVVKTQSVRDPSGGTDPVTGAVITYTIAVQVTTAGVATAAVIRDPVPTWTRYVAGSITLNGVPLTDAVDGDAGEFDGTAQPAVVARLGDLTQADGVQTVVFRVQVD